LLSCRSFPVRTFGSVSIFVLFWSTAMSTLVRGYLLTHYTPEILLNPVFEDLRMPKVPNRNYGYKLTKVPLLCYNESAIRMADNPVEHSRTKHIAIRYHFLRDHQQRRDIEIAYVSTKEQLADIFIKPLDEKTFTKLRNELNILDSWNFD
jgi:hypothetical protein